MSAVILDIGLPDGSGLELLQEIKRENPALPVILLTANDTDMDIVNGLEQGADDYHQAVFPVRSPRKGEHAVAEGRPRAAERAVS